MAEQFYRANILVCGVAGCAASGSQEVIKALEKEVQRRGLQKEVNVIQSGCRGFCAIGPIMTIYPEGIFYCQVNATDVPLIVEETLIKGRVVERLLYEEPKEHKALPRYKDIPFYNKQTHHALRNCGMIDPERINEYIAQDGYSALAKALTEMTPQQVIDEVKRSGLRGAGGGGFPAGVKWEFAARTSSPIKYVICNADEGDPGAFMDRSILEGDPHSVLEGMLVCGYAIGAQEGYVYCRAEYPQAIQRLKIAIDQANAYGLMGERILGTDFSFQVYLKEGAGAFVCGEETALIASIEGKRGEPRPKPPYTAVSGLWGKPSNVNNVKTLANVPQIILHGADWFRQIGTKNSPGTAIFALTGKIKNTGLVEMPMGTTLGELIFDIGGGIPNGKKFKAVQTGGPLGGCLPADLLNVQVDFDSLRAAGAIMGSGGMIVVDEDTCMVEFSKFFLTFAQAESCGKCVPCRVGGKRMLEVLTRISEGRGKLEDLDTLRAIGKGMQDGALCGLGQLTPGPVLSALRYFEDEFKTHILEHRCPTGGCKVLTRARCINACPAEVDVPAFVALIAQKRYAEALEIHRKQNPFAMICGRVCPAFCEEKCRRAEIGEPLAIRHVKRFMADHERHHPWTPARAEGLKSQKVAVVGAGPAGLTAALRLAQKGYPVTVFEKLPVAGGMMAVGIPEYRLPRDILRIEIENILRAGVELKTNMALGKDFTVDGLLDQQGFSAVILAIGAHKSHRMGLPGEDLPGVLHGTAFLKDVALGNPPNFGGKRVAVVGGGAVAIDAARMAWRFGSSKVHLVYRRTREDMPAWGDEIHQAAVEGIQFHFLTNPVRVLGADRVRGIECQAQKLGDFDRSARRRPVPIKGSDFVLDVDVLILAIGEAPDVGCLSGSHGISVNQDGTVTVSEDLATSSPGVFAAGDSVLGPATVVTAVAQGNKVAVAVDAYLKGHRVETPRFISGYHEIPQLFNAEKYADARRAIMPELPVEVRLRSIAEVELGLDESTAREECKRCLRCDLEWLGNYKVQGEAEEEEYEDVHYTPATT
ncbi:MAG TPA: FAD-dependent oxidoreductase [Terriglobia bacterium]|nr:FAD-dependent oxidoreductase [Terriglobia bacterium]